MFMIQNSYLSIIKSTRKKMYSLMILIKVNIHFKYKEVNISKLRMMWVVWSKNITFWKIMTKFINALEIQRISKR